MGSTLNGHLAGDPLNITPDEMFRRETDRFVKERLDKQSLDVGADRIARTAHAALKLLQDVRSKTGFQIPLAWESTYSDCIAAIEVYPAAPLISHGISGGGYKKKEKIEERKSIIACLEKTLQFTVTKAEMEKDADVLDAAVCVLAGIDFLLDKTYKPTNSEKTKREGWIWVREKIS